MMKDTVRTIRFIYLYLVTAIAIVLILISTIGFVNLVLKEYVLNVQSWEEINGYYECTNGVPSKLEQARPVVEEADTSGDASAVDPDCEAKAAERAKISHSNDVKRDVAQFLAMLLIALPLYLYHWGLIKKERK